MEHRAGGDDAVRPVFPDTPGQLAPDGWGVYRLHQQLIGVRRRHPWLHHARAEPLHLTNTQLVYQVGTDRQRLLMALNLQDTAVDLPAPAATAVAAGAAHPHQVNHQDVRVRLDAHGWASSPQGVRGAPATGSLPTTRCCSWRSRWRTHRSSRPGCR
jgi:cyclomaltodextrinase